MPWLRTRALRILCGWDKSLPYQTLRVGSSPPREREHISMSAVSHSAPWTGFCASFSDARSLAGASTILTGINGVHLQSPSARLLMTSVTPNF